MIMKVMLEEGLETFEMLLIFLLDLVVACTVGVLAAIISLWTGCYLPVIVPAAGIRDRRCHLQNPV